jgi:hypothetical protein
VQGLLLDSPGHVARDCLAAKAWAMVVGGLPKYKCV